MHQVMYLIILKKKKKIIGYFRTLAFSVTDNEGIHIIYFIHHILNAVVKISA